MFFMIFESAMHFRLFFTRQKWKTFIKRWGRGGGLKLVLPVGKKDLPGGLLGGEKKFKLQKLLKGGN